MQLRNSLMLIIFFANTSYACTFNVINLNFGAYNRNADTKINSNITINNCRNNALIKIKLSKGNSSNYNSRKMNSIISSSSNLEYNLYRDPLYNEIWGDGTENSSTVSITAKNKRPTNVTIYGKLPAIQPSPPAAGNYYDHITVLFEY